jgi:hypothetical protein
VIRNSSSLSVASDNINRRGWEKMMNFIIPVFASGDEPSRITKSSRKVRSSLSSN